MGEFLSIVLSVCLQYSCSVTSWIRTPSRNELIGGVPNSYHLYGAAVDVVPDKGQEEIIAKAFRDSGLAVKVYKDHIHVQVKITEDKSNERQQREEPEVTRTRKLWL